MNNAYVYLLASQKNGTLYVGVTSDLFKRIYEHKNHIHEGFTKKYKVTLLVYYEEGQTIYEAIKREKEIKGWSRKKENRANKHKESRMERFSK